MSKRNPVLILSLALIALSVSVGAGFGVFIFNQKADNADLNVNLPVASTSKQTYTSVTYQVGQKFYNGTSNYEIYFPGTSTGPNTSKTVVNQSLDSKYLPLGTQDEIGLPVVYKYRDGNYTLSTDFSFIGWTTTKNIKPKPLIKGYDYDPEVTPQLKDYVSDGYNLNSRVTDDTDNPKNLNLYPLFCKTPYSPIAITKVGDTAKPINIPKVSETIHSVSFSAYHLVNASNVSSITIQKNGSSLYNLSTSSFKSPALPLDLYISFDSNSKNTTISGLGTAYETVTGQFTDGTKKMYVSVYYKKA